MKENNYIRIPIALLLGLNLNLLASCSVGIPRESFSDEDAVEPANISGSFLTACAAEFGSVGCTVTHIKTGKIIRPIDYGHEPKYAMYQSKNLFEDTPEKLELEGAFKIEGNSTPIEESNATLTFSLLNPNFVIEGLYGDYKLSKEEKRDFNVGYQLTYDPSDYNPTTYSKKFARMDRCLWGVMMDTWLNDMDSSFIDIDLTPEEFSKNYQYLFTNDIVKDDRISAVPIEERPIKSIELSIETALDETPTNFEGEYTCRADYEKYKAGEDNTLFDTFENEVNELVVDYLFNFKKETPPKEEE